MTSYNQLKQDLIDLTENNSSGFSTESNQFIDTADSYGTGKLNGRSEELLGKFLQKLP